MASCLENIDPSTSSFIFIDEFDKAISKDLGVQIEYEILKMLEGSEVYVGESNSSNRKVVDTSKCNFILLGTFAHLKKDTKRAMGFNPVSEPIEPLITKQALIDAHILSNELLGRLNGGIIQLDSMTSEQALELLTEPRYSPIQRLSRDYGINIQVSPDKYAELADLTLKYGVRGIYSELTSRINDALFEDSSIKELTI